MLTLFIRVVCGHILGVVKAEKESLLALRNLQLKRGRWRGALGAKAFFTHQHPKLLRVCMKYQFIVELGFLVWVSFPPQSDKEKGKNSPGQKNSGNGLEMKAAKV